jgi:hypothetical protein
MNKGLHEDTLNNHPCNGAFAGYSCLDRSSTYQKGTIFVTPLGISPAAKYARSEPNYPSTSFERPSKNAMTGQTTSTIPSAGGLTGQPVPDSLTVSGHSWSNLVMAGYPSAYAKDDAVLRLPSALCPQCNEIETVPHLYRCQARAPWRHRFLIHLHGHLKEHDTAAGIRCIITKGIEKWFLIGDTNGPDSIDTVAQIGWFQVLKGYLLNMLVREIMKAINEIVSCANLLVVYSTTLGRKLED